MLPKKSEQIIPLTVEQTGFSKELVEDLLSFYWKEVRYNLVNCKTHNLFLKGLGTFGAKYWKLPGMIADHERIAHKYRTLMLEYQGDSFQKFSVLKETEDRLNKYYELQKKIDLDFEKKKNIKSKRNEKTIIKGNMESPEGDS